MVLRQRIDKVTFVFLAKQRPPKSTLFPYTTLFRSGVAARIFSALAHAGINVIAIAQGSSELNLSLVVDGKDAAPAQRDRKSTRLNSSHSQSSYAVFCLKKKIELR